MATDATYVIAAARNLANALNETHGGDVLHLSELDVLDALATVGYCLKTDTEGLSSRAYMVAVAA